jgi:hypothetical protein
MSWSDVITTPAATPVTQEELTSKTAEGQGALFGAVTQITNTTLIYNTTLPYSPDTTSTDALTSTDSFDSKITATPDPIPVPEAGFSVPALLGMAGFVLMDLSFDAINCAVKTLMLSHSGPQDHVSLLIVGVFVSAVGGCVTPVTGMVELSRLLPHWSVLSWFHYVTGQWSDGFVSLYYWSVVLSAN